MSRPHLSPPDKNDIAELELFEGLPIRKISLVNSATTAEAAHEALMRAGQVGFDTESKPTFQKGEKSGGPHVLQFATREHAYVFQSSVRECHPVIVSLLESTDLEKIGFGLKNDSVQILNRFGTRPNAVLDLCQSFKKLGYRNAVGAKSAIAILFQRRLAKSKSVTTSNWANTRLTESQLIYAANDAYAAIMVFHELKSRDSLAGQ